MKSGFMTSPNFTSTIVAIPGAFFALASLPLTPFPFFQEIAND